MSTFNSAAIEEFNGGVWVFCEQRQGVMMPTSFELISEGRKLADELGSKLYGILLGDKVEGIAKELGGYGADGVYVCESPLLKDYTTDGYTKVICDLVEEKKPEIFLIGATNIGRDLGPRCAARLHTGLCADCTHLDIDVANYQDFLRSASTLPEPRVAATNFAMVMGQKHDVSRDLKMTRPAFGGHLMASIICPRFRPAMATVRPGVMKKNAFDEARAAAKDNSHCFYTNNELAAAGIDSDKGIYISAGSACHQGKPSHVIATLNLPKKVSGGVIRLSFGPETTKDEIDACVAALKQHHDTRMPML